MLPFFTATAYFARLSQIFSVKDAKEAAGKSYSREEKVDFVLKEPLQCSKTQVLYKGTSTVIL
jgi:hypothetical protein